IEPECGIDNFGFGPVGGVPDRLRPNVRPAANRAGRILGPRQTPRATSSQRVKPTVSQSEMELVPTTRPDGWRSTSARSRHAEDGAASTGWTPDGPPCRGSADARGAHALGDADPRRADPVGDVRGPRAPDAPAPDRDGPGRGRRSVGGDRASDPRRPATHPRAPVRDDERGPTRDRARG